nr:hypothetical protein [Sphingomonas populi]
MLKGIKPLAIFADVYENFPDVVVRYLRCFDRCVLAGRLTKRDFVIPLAIPNRPEVRGIHRIYYTLPGEEWRVDEMMALMQRAGGWSPAREREFGSLLGYTDWQNDVWAQRFPYQPT